MWWSLTKALWWEAHGNCRYDDRPTETADMIDDRPTEIADVYRRCSDNSMWLQSVLALLWLDDFTSICSKKKRKKNGDINALVLRMGHNFVKY